MAKVSPKSSKEIRKHLKDNNLNPDSVDSFYKPEAGRSYLQRRGLGVLQKLKKERPGLNLGEKGSKELNETVLGEKVRAMQGGTDLPKHTDIDGALAVARKISDDGDPFRII